MYGLQDSHYCPCGTPTPPDLMMSVLEMCCSILKGLLKSSFFKKKDVTVISKINTKIVPLEKNTVTYLVLK